MNAEQVGRTVGGLEAGQRVLVVSRSWRAAGAALEVVLDAAVAADVDDGLTARRSARPGAAIESPRTGGVVRFVAGAGARGLSVDLLVLDEDLSDAAVAGALPAVAASRGEVLR